ncbi:MAG: hypothetical protein IT210_23405 [Armatimonadetes bacterium]|nr:hypothetical protein [Armatimonadota bacterium]
MRGTQRGTLSQKPCTLDRSLSSLNTGDSFAYLAAGLNPSPQGDFVSLLAPTLKRLYVTWTDPQESAVPNEIWLEGMFGKDPGCNRSVTLSAKPLKIIEWRDDVIKCSLPVDQPDLAVPCVVSARGHRSNTVRLALWKGKFTITYKYLGSAFQKLEADVLFRYDIHKTREVPGDKFVGIPSGALISADPMQTMGSSGNLTIGGSYTDEFAQTHTWSLDGSSLLPPYRQKARLGVVFAGKFDKDLKTFTFAAGCIVPGRLKDTVSSLDVNQSYTLDVKIQVNMNKPLTLGPDYSIPGGSVTVPASEVISPGNPGTVKLKWESFKPLTGAEPDAGDARSVQRADVRG